MNPLEGPPLRGPLKLPEGGPPEPPGGNGGRFCPGGPPGGPPALAFGGKGGIPRPTELVYARLRCMMSDCTYPEGGTRLDPCLEDPCREEGPCSEGKGAHLEGPSCREVAYLPDREASEDDLQAVRNGRRVEDVRRDVPPNEGGPPNPGGGAP